MKEKLKKQRNKLYLKIVLILLAVWIAVTSVFCAVRLSIEKANVQSSEIASLSLVKQILSLGDQDTVSLNSVLLENLGFARSEDYANRDFDTHLLITDRKTNQVTVDTADSVVVDFAAQISEEYTVNTVGLLNYDMVRGALSDEEYQTIDKWLNTIRDDGDYYELICTKMQLSTAYYVPLELKIVLVSAKDPRFLTDENVAAFQLDENYTENETVYESSKLRRNVVPSEFLLNRAYNRDLIGTLTKEQLKEAVAMIPAGTLECIFYASDYVNSNDSAFSTIEDAWRIQYAKKVDLLKNCRSDLAFGIALLFVFFLTIAVILCVMIWRTVKEQIVQEQKRLDLTGALAHDIKTPLFVISGYAYSLKENIDENERDLYLDNIIEQTDTINDLVHRMLNLSKLDSYNMTLNRTEFDLYDLVSRITNGYTALKDGKRFALSHSGDNVIQADQELIITVIGNLIDNALQYSLPQSEIQIDVSAKRLRISNPSEPMSKAQLQQLWQPYVRKDKSRHDKGNGLGLSIVKSILELHGAKYDLSMKDSDFVCSIEFPA